MKTYIHFSSYLAQFFLEQNENCFRQRLYRKSEHSLYVQQLLFENRAVYEIMWKNNLEPDRPQMTVPCMSFVCKIPEDTPRQSEYVILIAFPLQQWLHERVSLLRYTYIACIVISEKVLWAE